jgi:colicin import membrane protein
MEGYDMAREGVTYAEVAAAADRMVADGANVTIMGVRDVLGTGSPNTIHRHLQVWRSMRPQAAAAAFELPAELVNAFGRELAKAAAAARAEIEEQVVEAQLAADHLSNVGETLEAERDDALDALVAMTTERDAATATAAERAEEIKRLSESVALERQSADTARVELATAKLKIEALAEKTDEFKVEVRELKAALGEAKAAEQVAAVELSKAQAEVAAERAAKAELVAERDTLKQSLRSMAEDAARERGEHRDALAQCQSQVAAERKAAAEALALAQAEAKGLTARSPLRRPN